MLTAFYFDVLFFINKINWIHRMSSILSEISSKVNISSLKDKLKDVLYDINNKVFSKKTEENHTENKDEKKTDGEKEGYAEPPPPKTTKEKIVNFLNKLKDIFIVFAFILLRVIFYVGLASLVANDMIIYAPTIRAFFFVFTFMVTFLFAPYAFFLACYYALRKGYDYYHDKLSSEIIKPPKSFPMLFAILPLTTYYPDTPLLRFLLWAFMYQKSDNIERMEKENKRLDIIMKGYWDSLNQSFDYLNKIKKSEPFSRLYELNKEHLTVQYMHPIRKKETVPEIPPVIEKNVEDVTFHPMQAAPNKNVNKPVLYTMRPADEAEKLSNVKPSEHTAITPVAVVAPAPMPSTI